MNTGGFKVFLERIKARAELRDVTDQEYLSFPTLSTRHFAANMLDKGYGVEKDYEIVVGTY